MYSECEKIERQKRNEKVIKASTKVVRLVFMMGFSRATRTAAEEEAAAEVEGEEAVEQAEAEAEGERQHTDNTHSNKTLVNEEAKGPRCLSIKMPLSCDTDTHTNHTHTHTYAHTHTPPTATPASSKNFYP